WKALGASLLVQGKEALPVLQKAIELLPNDAEAHFNLGNSLGKLGQFDGAVASYRRALGIKPDYAEAHFNLGISLGELGQFDGAVASYRRALEIKSDYAGARNNLGAVFQAQNRLDDAIYSFQKAIEINPDSNAYRNLGIAFNSRGNFNDALACFQKASELGSNGAKVQAAIMLPAILGTRQEVLTSRTVLEQNVEQLIDKPVQIDDPLKEVGETNFYSAFHGLNDRDLQVKIAKLYEKACPSLLHIAPHCTKPRPAGKSVIRVGFLSKYIHTHSVSRCFSRVVEELAQREWFEVVLISSHDFDDPQVRNSYPEFVGTRTHLPSHLERAREMVAALKLDILVYLDIGMEPLSYFLAFSRLARVQCVLGGHPVTTGIANIDYFLSADLMEPSDATKHYSEKLVRLPRGVFYFERPTLPTTLKTRSELGLPERRHIYMCPMKLQKIHPDFDEAISRILQIDSNGVVVLFEDHQHPSWKALLEKRFDETILGDERERILFLPWINEYADFISANAVADVVLDPFHFGIGSTIIATFAVGTPIVTKPGEFMRGRVGMGFCKMMGLMECIAEDTEGYAQKAVAIASDKLMREKISAKILNNSHLLYENKQPVNDFADFLVSLMDRPTNQP
ncbi:MAG: tetratricopeptide repeat protein, partial [Sulfuricellaceae bacterium]|nr:tetratricopeptide repeat protein [Sulfuricellaceae bacterium]